MSLRGVSKFGYNNCFFANLTSKESKNKKGDAHKIIKFICSFHKKGAIYWELPVFYSLSLFETSAVIRQTFSAKGMGSEAVPTLGVRIALSKSTGSIPSFESISTPFLKRFTRLWTSSF